MDAGFVVVLKSKQQQLQEQATKTTASEMSVRGRRKKEAGTEKKRKGKQKKSIKKQASKQSFAE